MKTVSNGVSATRQREAFGAFPAEAPAPRSSRVVRCVRFLVAWSWRVAVGALLCMNFLSSILVVGWLYRWMQAVVLRGWWKQSRFFAAGTFADFCDSLGTNAPVPRPRWLLRERIGDALAASTATVEQAHSTTWRILTIPWHSLWLNFKVGLPGILCTLLLTGWGVLLMQFSWDFGWLNSFTKGYEQSFVGPITGLLGALLFVVAMLYVPLAQVHQAATGDYRAFFEFRFLGRLIRTCPGRYVALAALFVLVSLLLEVLKTVPGFEFFWGNDPAYSDLQALWILRWYLLACGAVLFLALLLLRGTAACTYRSALLKALRQGRVRREELHPTLAAWLDRLELDVRPEPRPAGLRRVARFGARSVYRLALTAALVLLWVVFVAKTYLGEFLSAHPPVAGFLQAKILPGVYSPTEGHRTHQPFAGFTNHPLVQLPCFDLIPQHLLDAARK